ncbi:hypothetical protein [Candidatus Finniella inopinata]|uniref:Uncharacterized protein n=1 Tax=Candidatus Finniella inopinata TaxID=1696036 RepID=A0A4Q7DK08_9PROT|nr:hypothetical protein [Candidatus Finniella inopinata]RZI46374.1 hypothetical protein EQU50_01940 [Candidatus Finniella inopinata]
MSMVIEGVEHGRIGTCPRGENGEIQVSVPAGGTSCRFIALEKISNTGRISQTSWHMAYPGFSYTFPALPNESYTNILGPCGANVVNRVIDSDGVTIAGIEVSWLEVESPQTASTG